MAFILRNVIPYDIFDYLELTSVLSRYANVRGKIRRLLADGEMIRIKKGLYTFPAGSRRYPLNPILVANRIYGPSYVSGDYGAEDHLDIDRTGIHQDLTAKFENSSSYRGKYGHTGENITEDDEKLALLVKEGRAAKLNEQTKQTEQPTQNKQSDEMILE